MDQIPVLMEHRSMDMPRTGTMETVRMEPPKAMLVGAPEIPRPGSLGRNRQPMMPQQNRPRQPAQVVTTGSRNHIVYTDQKGRKIPYSDTTKRNAMNHTKKSESTFLNAQHHQEYNFKVGIYGWRKRCLYLLILGLMIMMIINLALTIWVLKVMDFNMDGMGQLKIVPGGIQLLGQAMAMDSIYASTIRSRKGQPITLESSRNFTINTRSKDGYLENQLFLGNDRLECTANIFKIMDPRGGTLFSANSHEVVVGVETLRANGAGGVSISGSLQTPTVRASSGNQLLLESPTRSLEIKAAQTIKLESRAGDITASCLTGLRLQSTAGSIKLEAANVFMPKLKSALPLSPTTSHSRDPHHHDIYQLCACANGKLFLASPHGVCAAKEDSYVCR